MPMTRLKLRQVTVDLYEHDALYSMYLEVEKLDKASKKSWTRRNRLKYAKLAKEAGDNLKSNLFALYPTAVWVLSWRHMTINGNRALQVSFLEEKSYDELSNYKLP